MEQQIHIFTGIAEAGRYSCFQKMVDKSESLTQQGWFVMDTSTISWVDKHGKAQARMVVTYRRKA